MPAAIQTLSVCGLVRLAPKPVLARLGGCDELTELRSATEVREQGIGLQGVSGAVVAVHGALEQVEGAVILAAVGHQSSKCIGDFGVRVFRDVILQPTGDLVQFGGRGGSKASYYQFALRFIRREQPGDL